MKTTKKKLEVDTLLRMKGNLEEMKSIMKLKRKMMTLEGSKEYLRDKGLISMDDYNRFYDENSEECYKIGLPKYPEYYYEKSK